MKPVGMPSSQTHLGGAGLDVGRSLHSQLAAGLRFGRRHTRSWHFESQMEGAVKVVEFPVITAAYADKVLATKDD